MSRGDLDEGGEHLDEGLLAGLVEALQGDVDPVAYFLVAKLRRKTQLVDRTFDALLGGVIRSVVERLGQLLGIVLLALPRCSSRLPSPTPIGDGRWARVALDDVLDDALGSASEDLIAVLALHLLAVAILALGEAVDVVPDFRRRAGERSCSCDGHPERGANDLWVIAFSYSPI